MLESVKAIECTVENTLNIHTHHTKTILHFKNSNDSKSVLTILLMPWYLKALEKLNGGASR